ncbi:aldo/keto reductase [Paenibacillus thermoaerophilus]|nr:aldo/keto reductase [Paenibacillus thermoaerophilus]
MFSPIGLGCWQFSRGRGIVGKYWGKLEETAMTDIVRECLAGGVNWFDTAEIYGSGQSEQSLARALDEIDIQPGQAHIATKWWPLLRTSASIAKTIELRCRALSGHPISLYQVHQPYSFSSVAAEMREMAKLAEDGRIGQIGVSNYSARQMRTADKTLRGYGLRLTSNQVKFSLLDRRIEHDGVLETAKELGVAIIAYSPLEQGLLTGKFHRRKELAAELQGPRKWMPSFRPDGLKRVEPLISRLEEIAEARGASVSQIALAWLLGAHGDTVFAIPGASRPEHARDNAGAMSVRLTADERAELSELSDRVRKRRA